VNLGCHAVLFGNRIKTDTDNILKNLAKTGFAGIEAGFRFFGDNVSALAEALDKQGLMLSGFHIGVKFNQFLAEPEKTGDFLYHIADKIREIPEKVMPLKNIVMSASFENLPDDSLPEENLRTLEEASVNLDEIASNLKRQGVIINYHNHALEFSDGGVIYQVLRDHVPNMNFAFDLGWVEAGGGDIETVLKETAGRVWYVHLRDVAPDRKDFADLGKGISDLPKIISLVKEAVPGEGWLVVEYETGEQDFDRYTRARDYLRELGW
jgi:sugar phosphate isomerase/epimerase